MHANIGQRLLRVKQYVKDEEIFMANYADGLTDMPLNAYIDEFKSKQAIASFMATRTSQSLHCVHSDDGGAVTSFGQIAASEFWINAGFFCLRPEIFNYIEDGDELVEKPFQRLIDKKMLQVHRYDGFWQQMDTFKEKIIYDRMEARGKCPWMLWKK